MHRIFATSGPDTQPAYVASNVNIITIKTMDLIKIAEEAFATGKQHPEFGPGDTIMPIDRKSVV